MTESIRKKSIVELGALPPNPRNLALSGQNGCWGSTTIEALEREGRAPQECDPSADSSAGMAGAASAAPNLEIRPADPKLIAPEKWS